MRKIYLYSLFMGVATLFIGCSKQSTQDCSPQGGVAEMAFVHKYGMEVPRNEWENRGKNGQVISTLKNGVVVRSNYVDGVLNGKVSYTFPHSGIIAKEEVYSQGNLLEVTENFPSEQAKRKIVNLSPEEVEVHRWYENGTNRSRELFVEGVLTDAEYYAPNNQVECRISKGSGERVNRDDYGAIASRDHIENGDLIRREVFYLNGTPKEITPYRAGAVEGERRTFLPGGEPLSIEQWENNQQHGVTTLFQNGERLSEIAYRNGVKDGVEKRFRDGTFVAESITWRHGQKHGPSYSYLGGNTHTTWYFQGREVTKRQFDRLVP